MENNIVVSVIVAVYNMEKYLKYCINSVLEQSYQNFEIILVNDGSCDTSEQIIDSYVAKYPKKIRKINKENGGLSSARNIAFNQVRGKYITFLDADDYYDKEYLKIIINKAETENLDMVCSGQHKVTQNGEILKTIRYKLKNGICLQRRLNISGKLYRTEYINKWKIKFPEGKTYEDNSFNMQAMFLTSKVGFVEYEGYYQVVHEGSITSKPIDSSQLPFEEWEMCAKKIKEAAVEGVDLELFEFTYMSFLTYFLFVRNRKREYLSNENRNISMKSIIEITEEFQNIVNTYFKNYRKNQYVKLLKNIQLSSRQKLATLVFSCFCEWNQLKKLVELVYKFI